MCSLQGQNHSQHKIVAQYRSLLRRTTKMENRIWKAFGILAGGVLFILTVNASYAAPPTPQRGGILKISARGEAPTLNSMMNPSVAVMPYMAPVFNGLVMIDPTQGEVGVEKVVPALAEKWTVSSDGRIYTFFLRKGIRFHDGQPFTAKDAKYSLDFFADPAKSALASLVGMMDKVEVVDNYTIKVFLKYPHLPFLFYLSYPYCVMLPAHLAKVNSKSPDFLIGTGPFKFKSRIPGKVWIYERNPEYFLKGLPYLEGVEIYNMDWEPALNAFIAGRLDMPGNLRFAINSGLTLDKIKKHVPEAIIKLKPAGSIRGVWFNVAGLKGRKGPWQDVRVRRAMALATDFPGSIIAAQGSLELGIASGVVPPNVPTGLPGEEAGKTLGIDKPMEQRIEKAKRLMKEAGYLHGFKGEIISRNQTHYWKSTEFMIESWRKNLNIQVEMKVLENAILFPRRDTGDFDMIYEGTPGMYGGAPEETLAYFMSNSIANYGKWSHQEYDKFYEKLMQEPDPRKRKEISVKMQKIFLEEVPSIINYTAITGTAHRPTLHGFVIGPGHTNWACMDRIWLGK